MNPLLIGIAPGERGEFLRRITSGEPAPSRRRHCLRCGVPRALLHDGVCVDCQQHGSSSFQGNTPRVRDVIAQKQASLAKFQRTGASQPAPEVKQQRNRWASLEAEAHAMSEGKRLGRLHNGDPWAVAQAINMTVMWGDAGKMRAKGSDAWSLRNPLHASGPHMAVLANDLRGRQLDEVLAHELGHIVLGKGASERNCDVFSKYLLEHLPRSAPR